MNIAVEARRLGVSVGRDAHKLAAVADRIPGIETAVVDATDRAGVDALFGTL